MLLTIYYFSSLYLLVFDNDRVIRYTRAYDVAGGAGETQRRRRAT